jgi:flagellar biosynthesis component FlhA
MSLAEAGQIYTLLTIGDGLVSQIPALLISTAAGIIVSRAGSEGNLSNEMTSQLLGNPKTVVSAPFVFFIGALPGLPIHPVLGHRGFLPALWPTKGKKEDCPAGREIRPGRTEAPARPARKSGWKIICCSIPWNLRSATA